MKKVFVSHRDIRLAGTGGDVILMKSGVKQNVPVSLQEIAISHGCREIKQKTPPTPAPVGSETDLSFANKKK